MARTTTRPPRLPNGTRVHVRSDHFAEECDAIDVSVLDRYTEAA